MTVGFIGLGNMGSALAANLVGAGLDVVAYDVAGAVRCPDGARFAASVQDVAQSAEIVVLSLPDGNASREVAGALAASPGRRVTYVLDTSTIGVEAAQLLDAELAAQMIGYVDAPVSGGVAGARARTLTVMHAGSARAREAVEPVLAGLSDRRYQVGDRPGMAQALKLANNFLSATALVATSEAIAFGLSIGLELSTMLEVLGASSGQNAAVTDKFPKHIVPGTYDSGFASALMNKDVALYCEAVQQSGGAALVAPVTGRVWQEFADDQPHADFTRIFTFVQRTPIA